MLAFHLPGQFDAAQGVARIECRDGFPCMLMDGLVRNVDFGIAVQFGEAFLAIAGKVPFIQPAFGVGSEAVRLAIRNAHEHLADFEFKENMIDLGDFDKTAQRRC